MHDQNESMETLVVHGGERRPGPEGSVVYPIYQGTVYSIEPGTAYHDLPYIRLNSTPSQRYLHDKLAALEGAEASVATASGMAAVTTTLLSLLRVGDHVLASDCLYGGTHDFLTQHAGDLGWRYSFVDVHRPETWTAARTPQTKVFLVETITNPLMRVGLLREIVDFARREGMLAVIDNTFATPVNFRPLQAGFDLSIHSATKYLGGHSDLVAGAVMGSAELIDQVRRTLNLYGGSLDPHAGFLLARGIKTLALRVRARARHPRRKEGRRHCGRGEDRRGGVDPYFHWCRRSQLPNPRTSSSNGHHARPRPPHLHRQVSRHGKTVWYVRIGKGPRVRIRSDFGTPLFDAQYQAAIEGLPARQDTKDGASDLEVLLG